MLLILCRSEGSTYYFQLPYPSIAEDSCASLNILQATAAMNGEVVSSQNVTALEEEKDPGCLAEELADAHLLPKGETLGVIESLTLAFLQTIARGEDPEILLVSLIHLCNRLCY